jgi:MarR family transcriptional regulator, organic hydroperoxide resistance regulator
MTRSISVLALQTIPWPAIICSAMEHGASGSTTGRARAAKAGPVTYALAIAARTRATTLQDRLRALGLHLGQELIVVDLHEFPDSSQAELVERLAIEQPTVAKALARLERAGFVNRRDDQRDRRRVVLRLTERGQKTVPSILAAWSAVEQEATRKLTTEEKRLLKTLLNKIT